MERTHTIGRRKNAVARIFMSQGNGTVTVNGKPVEEYFPVMQLQLKINKPFEVTELSGKYDVVANVNGGGINGQAIAVQHAISRALVKNDEELRPLLKKVDLLTRDPRMVERKKYGQKKARKGFQFSKR